MEKLEFKLQKTKLTKKDKVFNLFGAVEFAHFLTKCYGNRISIGRPNILSADNPLLGQYLTVPVLLNNKKIGTYAEGWETGCEKKGRDMLFYSYNGFLELYDEKNRRRLVLFSLWKECIHGEKKYFPEIKVAKKIPFP